MSFSNEQPATEVDANVDVSLTLVKDKLDTKPLDPEQSRKLRIKLDWHLLPLLFTVYCLQFLDKTTLGTGYILGLVKDNHLTTNQFNTLGSAFYIGFLVFQYPQNWALQVFPVGKWMAFNIFLWSVFLGLHAVCKDFGGLFVLRFLLGASEGSMTAGLLIVTAMFYTRTEIGERVGSTFQCNGVGTILSGFISFGVAHASSDGRIHQWQWLMIITCLLTFVLSILFLFFFPDDPIKARFLTEEEKILHKQFVEALTDIKLWLFFLFAAISDLQNGLGTQYSRVIQQFGFNQLQTTLLNRLVVRSLKSSVTFGMYIFRCFPNSRTWISILFWIPNILGALLLMLLPQSNKVGHLIGLYLMSGGGVVSFILTMSWVSASVGGHTKKLTANAMYLIGYSLGQILCTQFWKEKYGPRYLVPWGIALAAYVTVIIITLLLRHILVTENRRRDALKVLDVNSKDETLDDFGYVLAEDSDGKMIRHKVDKGFLDLTDKQNLGFRYVL
ncbi:MFS general substrate transporter [Mycena floridula]|nr:MFS general substrate transporter [Mycena floridula]